MEAQPQRIRDSELGALRVPGVDFKTDHRGDGDSGDILFLKNKITLSCI